MTSAAAGSSVIQTRLRVLEGSCLDCAGDLQATLGRFPGVRAVQILGVAGIVIVDHDPEVSVDALRRAAARCGLRLAEAGTETLDQERPWWRKPEFLALTGAAILLAAGFAAELLLKLPSAATWLFLGAVGVGGVYPVRHAIDVVRRGRLTIGTLLVTAAIGALALGVVEEAALLVVVFSLGEVLEAYAADRARGSIRALMSLSPPVALLKGPERSLPTLVPVETLVPGDVVIVRPGERLPTDGRVIQGFSAVDQSPVTGESIPVEVMPGVRVFGGTVNGSGALEIEVTREWTDTTLAQIIRQVEEAQAAKGRAERFADRFGAVYTPVMFILAAAVAIVPTLLGGDPREGLYRGLVVLTVSCSCALVISVPVSVVAAISRAARDGILIKGGVYLERLGGVRVIAFDKTGTLTQGRPALTDIVAIDGLPEDEVLRLAARVEAASEHPLAGAIVAAAQARGLDVTPGGDLQSIPGIGVEATVEGRRLFVGRPIGSADGDGEPVGRELLRLEQAGSTAVVLRDGDRVIGILGVADAVREGAAGAITELRSLGIDRLVLLTGDNERTAQAVARGIGLSEWRAGLLPADKTAAVAALRAEGGLIAMVGDGVNDAPALATADVGIAMGAAGTDVALETAPVALMADDLAKLPVALRLARRALGNIRQNIVMSLAAIAILVSGALAGWLTLTTGLLLNEGTALLIIANGLRLLRSPRPSPARSRAGTREPGRLAGQAKG